MTSTILTFSVVCVVTSTVAAQSPPPIAAPLMNEVAALREQSLWRIDSDRADPRGAIPIGNGLVFACLGLDAHACALSAMTGPRYGAGDVDAAGEGAFGGWSLELVDASGTPLAPGHRSVARVTGAGVAVAEDRYQGAALRMLAFTVPGSTRIEAVIEAVATGDALPAGLSVRLRTTRAAQGDGDRLLIGSKDAWAAIALGGATARQGQLMVPLGGSASWNGLVTIDTAEGKVPARTAMQPKDARADLEQTLASWKSRLGHTPTFDSDNLRIRDLFRDQAVNLLTQCCATTGAIVPMLGRRVFSLRTQTGALLALLRLRLHDDSRRILALTFDAVRATRRFDAEFPLDFDRSRASDGAANDAAFWRNVPIAAAELPSLVLLQHYWYWRATRDLASIETNWLLLETCLKRPTRSNDSLMPFSGTEPWAPDRLVAFGHEFLGSDPRLFGENPRLGRASWSFASGVLFLLSLQAYGELGDARDRAARPAEWAKGKPEDAPSNAFLRRAVTLLQDIEKRFWIADLQRFAPAVSPVDGSPVREVLANANLMPLWAGWTYPTGEKSKENIEHSLSGLWQTGSRIGTTRTVAAATGDLVGMLLAALSERDDVRRMDVFDAALDSAAPTGCWSDWVDGDGHPLDPDGDGPRRAVLCDPGTSGVVFDALVFAMTGIRYAAVPHWDDDDIRLELRLPHGADYVTLRGACKDGRVLDIFFRRSVSMMTEEERAANDELSPDRRRDPNVPHERLRFVVELIEGSPKDGYYNTDIDAMGTMFVRYLKREAPATAEEHDFRRIEEMEFSKADTNEFFHRHDGAGEPPKLADFTPPPGVHTLVLTWRPHFAELVRGAGATVVDTGIPLSIERLRGLLFDRDQLRHARIVLDWQFDSAPPTTWNQELFAGAAWRQLLDRFRALGGLIADTGFVRRASLDGALLQADADGAFHVPPGPAVARLVITMPEAPAAGAAVHVGAAVACRLFAGETRLLAAAAQDPVIPDRDAALLPTVVPRELVLELDPSPDRERVVYLRIAGADGLPPR